jgi:tRNA threonylcarbamoyladenosine biosynthesis protein TsaE
VLSSDLGGGKTVFVKGLAKGAGSNDTVSSPTFTISKVYKCLEFNIQHFDFYRLNDPGIISLELQEVLNDSKNVVVIEWADIVAKVLPNDYFKVEFDQLGQDNRLIKISCPKKLAYLIEGLR